MFADGKEIFDVNAASNSVSVLVIRRGRRLLRVFQVGQGRWRWDRRAGPGGLGALLLLRWIPYIPLAIALKPREKVFAFALTVEGSESRFLD